MIITSWNVNSVRARIENIKEYLQKFSPDVVMMQEIKTQDETFPYDDFSALDYESHVFGQKRYNGVAIISKHKLENVRLDLIKDKLKQSRIISAELKHKKKNIQLINIYTPNGNPVDTDKYSYKKEWIDSLNDEDLITHHNPGPDRIGIVGMFDKGIEMARTDIIMAFHSDMVAAPNLDKHILKYLKPGNVVAATRIEPSLHPPGPEKIIQDFCSKEVEPEYFNEENFLDWFNKSKDERKDKTTEGIFATWAIYKKKFKILESKGKTTILTSEGYYLVGKNIIFDNENKFIKSNDSAVITDLEKNNIFLENFEYSSTDNFFKSVGKIKVIDSKKNSYNFSQIYIDEKKKGKVL